MTSPIKGNRSLGSKPKIANMIPADLGLPIIVFLGLSILGHTTLKIPPIICFGFFAWSSASWWLFAGDKPWLHLSKLMPKTPTWGTAQIKYRYSDENLPKYQKDEQN